MPEVTDQYIRIPTGDRKKKGEQIVTITVSASRGIKALYDKKNKVIVTYLFDVKKWSMKDAKAWVKRHKSNAAYTRIVELRSLRKDQSKLYRDIKKAIIKEVVCTT